MAESQTLIPVFVPPLAAMLAASEKKKGSALTLAEAEGIRDKSACIMMKQADASKMAESRGYVDVNPENFWPDWHRLRGQIAGGYLPKIVLCLPGGEMFRARSEAILRENAVEYEFQPHFPEMVKAFKASSMTWPCFDADDFARIESHSVVLYVLSKHLTAASAPIETRRFLTLGQRLLDVGAFALKVDSSGISHSAARWRKLFDLAARGEHGAWTALYHAFVVHPISSKDDLYSCGMHLLGAPDMIVSAESFEGRIPAGQNAPGLANELFNAFGIYLVSECPVGKFASGHTFSLAKNEPRYRMKWEPCTGYPDDSYFFNPFGRWRFTLP